MGYDNTVVKGKRIEYDMSSTESETIMATDAEWQARAKNLVKAELKRRGVSYAQLAEKLAEIGVHDTERNISNKLSRGSFTAVFLLQVLEAIGVRELHV